MYLFVLPTISKVNSEKKIDYNDRYFSSNSLCLLVLFYRSGLTINIAHVLFWLNQYYTDSNRVGVPDYVRINNLAG